MAQSPYFKVATRAAERAGIDPNIFTRQISQESGFDPNARSPAGAVGIAQVVPRYHPDAPSDPVGQLNWAANYLGGLVRKYGGNYAQALSVYNSGRPDTYKDPNFAGGETYRYVKNILSGIQPSAPSLGQPPPLPNAPPQAQSILSSSPLANPIVQDIVARNDKLLGIAPPVFPPPQPLTPPTQDGVTQAPPGRTPTIHVSTKSARGLTTPVREENVHLIGLPYEGTHAKSFNESGGSDNWESENAVDVSAPVGTPVVAVTTGVIGPQFGSLGEGGRFAGLRLHLNGDGNEFYYAHLSSYAKGIKPGVLVKKGQVIGYTGQANGVAHLHFASLKGSPTNIFRGYA